MKACLRRFPGEESRSSGLHARHDSLYRTGRIRRQVRPGVIPISSLPRWCPRCECNSIIGHGTRRKQAHDSRTDIIVIRRGLCPRCRTTFTVLPLWSLPRTHYSLVCREQACDGYENCHSAERAAPLVKDAGRVPDGSTVRRWIRRRIASWCLYVRVECLTTFRLPTIFAWDWLAAAINLPTEAISP